MVVAMGILMVDPRVVAIVDMVILVAAVVIWFLSYFPRHEQTSEQQVVATELVADSAAENRILTDDVQRHVRHIGHNNRIGDNAAGGRVEDNVAEFALQLFKEGGEGLAVGAVEPSAGCIAR